LTWCLEDSRARTSPQPERALGSTGRSLECGGTWRASSMRFDRDSSSWRTAHSLFPEDLGECSAIFPNWGVMRDGVLSGQMPLGSLKSENERGFLVKWPTPCHGTPNWGGSFQEVGGSENWLRFTWLGRQKVNPEWWEWLMGWPIGWTDLEPLGKDKFRRWCASHGTPCRESDAA
jgi:hypothetical protein